MPRGHERPRPTPSQGYERLRRLADELALGDGPAPVRVRRPVAVARPWTEEAMPRFLLAALGGAGLFLLIGWLLRGTGIGLLCGPR